MSTRKFNELSENEKELVRKHFCICMTDKSMDCYKLHKTIEDFWEAHKEMDYEYWR